jgi:hypothetical protein
VNRDADVPRPLTVSDVNTDPSGRNEIEVDAGDAFRASLSGDCTDAAVHRGKSAHGGGSARLLVFVNVAPQRQSIWRQLERRAPIDRSRSGRRDNMRDRRRRKRWGLSRPRDVRRLVRTRASDDCYE